ncbi:MAG: CPBP family intramembrane metalloprotease [Bacillota bacterium]|nr:CPBP family intramembrane metalloprotease [Bacillota bacterium]
MEKDFNRAGGGFFKNRNSQIRSGWKIAGAFSSFFLVTNIAALLVILAYIIYESASNKIPLDQLTAFLTNLDTEASDISTGLGLSMNLLQCLCMIFVVVLFWRVFQKRPIRDIGMISIRTGSKDLLIGLIFGAVSLSLVFVILLAVGSIDLVNPLSNPHLNLSMLTGLVLFIFVGIDEEMFSRGYCITVLKQTGNKYVIFIVSAVVFALMHSFNPGMNAFSYVNLFLFGLLTAYMAIKSGNLWLSIGYHITWNYFEGNVFGFLVSGQTTNSAYNLKVNGYNLINGGAFGPEGGIVVTLVLGLSFLFLWKVYKPSCKAGPPKFNADDIIAHYRPTQE